MWQPGSALHSQSELASLMYSQKKYVNVYLILDERNEHDKKNDTILFEEVTFLTIKYNFTALLLNLFNMTGVLFYNYEWCTNYLKHKKRELDFRNNYLNQLSADD